MEYPNAIGNPHWQWYISDSDVLYLAVLFLTLANQYHTLTGQGKTFFFPVFTLINSGPSNFLH